MVLNKSMVTRAFYRIIFIFCIILIIPTLGLSLIVFAPAYTWFFFRERKFLKYSRYWIPGCIQVIDHFTRIFSNGRYRVMFRVKLTDPIRSTPDLGILRLSKSWQGNLENCNGCISCCNQLGCIFLDREKKQCVIYGSFFWKYFNCGRYPSNQFQIDYYNCPKWEIKEPH